MKQKLYLKKVITLAILVLLTLVSIPSTSSNNFQETISDIMGNTPRQSCDCPTQNSCTNFPDVDRNDYDSPYFVNEEENTDYRNLWKADSSNDYQEFEQGSLLVKFKPGVNVSDSENILSSVRLIAHDDPSIVPIRSAQPVFSEQVLRQNARRKQQFGLDRWVQLVFTDENTDVPSEVEKYRNHPLVENAEPNYIVHTDSFPNDPYFNKQWGLHNTGQTGGKPDADIDAPEAWDIETGSNSIIIAVIDTGVDYAHPDLIDNMWINSDEIPGNNIDDDNNNFIDDYYGYDFCTFNGAIRDPDPQDECGHGTHCSGIIAARTNNNIGVAGTSWNCKIMAVKFLDAGGWGTYEDAAAAIVYAVDNGANILSNSWGGGFFSQAVKDAVDYASKSAIIVAAAGNSGQCYYKSYPAGYDQVIAVAATYHNDTRPFFSNYGYYNDKWVDVSAPGCNIYSTMPTYDVYLNHNGYPRNYSNMSGTSMACPFVAGVIGLVKSHHLSWTNNLVTGTVLSTADPIDSLNPGYELLLGTGRINAYNALTEDPQPSIIFERSEVDDYEGNYNGFLEPGETIHLNIALRNNWRDATHVTATLSTSHPQVTITSSTADFGDIATLTTATNYFTLYLDASATRNQFIDFTLVITADGGYSQTISPVKVEVSNPYQAGWPFIDFTFGGTDRAINIGDLDGNGDKEVVLNMYNRVYAWNHRGELLDGWPITITPQRSALGDLDGDGHCEIVFGTGENPSYELRIFNYTGREITDGWPKVVDNSIDQIAVADIDNDDRLEIICIAGCKVYAFNFDGSDVPGFPVDLENWDIGVLTGLAIGDVDNNGFLEIVAVEYKHVFVISNSGKVLYDWHLRVISGTGCDNQPVLADLDNDGNLEIVLGGERRLSVWRYNGETMFSKILIGPGEFVVGDVNSDGRLDIVVCDGNRIFVFDNHGRLLGRPITMDHVSFPLGIFDISPVLADIDGDNETEIILNGVHEDAPNPCYSWEICAFNSDGSSAPGFPIIERWHPNPYIGFVACTPAIADLDNDGDVELCTYSEIAQSPFFIGLVKVVVYDLPSPYNPGKSPWPLYKHDPQRTGAHPLSPLVITNPRERTVYLAGIPLMTRIFFYNPIIIGKIDIEVMASDPDGIDRVEFYVDNKLLATDTSEPYNVTWTEKAFGKYTIKIIAYNNVGNNISEEIVVWRFL